MKKLMAWLLRLPPWILTAVCALAIAWLTLAPHPIGDVEVPLFPGADKLVHGIMFGGLGLCIVLDWMRRDGRWHAFSWRGWFVAGVVASLAGLGVEYCQLGMEMGRSFEWADWGADTVGAFVLPLLAALSR